MDVALIFDCDGVLADTERHGHLPAFNQTFEEFGLPVRWTEEHYGRKLLIGGGKERLASILDVDFVQHARLPSDPVRQSGLVGSWHRRKTEIYTGIVASGALPARPGIARLLRGALVRGWTVAVASTSAGPSVEAVLKTAAGEHAADITIFAGDVVRRKKPAPDIYQLAVQELALDPERTLVVEDSRNGLLAAKGAGLRCVITVNDYTRTENMSEAELVVSSLGDPGGAVTCVLANRTNVTPGSYVTLDDLYGCLTSPIDSRS